MKRFLFPVLLIISILILSACNQSKPIYSKRAKTWDKQFFKTPDKALAYTVFLIGDAGKPESEPLEPNLKLLQAQLEAVGTNSAVVFLGDNIYPAGLPPKDDPFRPEAERRINTQLDILENFKGRPYMIPGNHDWNHWEPGGREAIRRQQKYVEKYLGNSDSYYPTKGCGDPKAIELTDNLTLIMIDSQWWLQDWDGEPNINKGCKVEDREDFEIELAELVDKYDDTNILLCMHHPIYTTGGHGGYASLKDHIFPLTHFKSYLYLPLPILGSIPQTARYLGVTTQDVTNRKNQDMVDDVLSAIFRVDDVVVASGHEHITEYFSYDKENQHFIVTGSGCRATYGKPVNDAHLEVKTDFLLRKEAFTKMLYYEDGSVFMEIWSPNGDGSEGEVVFRKMIKYPTFTVGDPVVAGDPKAEEPTPDTVAIVTNDGFEAGGARRFWIGNLYRDAWLASVDLPVIDMGTKKGGLVPIKKGGGQSTRSLRLQAMDGNQYVLRSVNKDATTFLPIFARNNLLDKIAQDVFAMGHPYAPQVIPPMATAVGVYHTNPEFYFLPDQQNLGDFSPLFAGDVYLFEERPSKNWEHAASFGNSKKIMSYRKMLHNVREDQDHKIDQESALRTRLFDVMITDIDRHDDQFRWASFKEGDKTIYRPIPRDRDLAFLKLDGVLPWLGTRKWSVAREAHSFEPKFQDIIGTAKSGVHFDRGYINELDREDWRRISEKMKVDLTDDIVDEAFHIFPDTLYQLDGEWMSETMKSRRDRLPDEADKYYAFLAKQVDIVGTDDRELFEVTRMDGGTTKVEVFVLSKKGKVKEKYYERTFYKKETKEIRLFGRKDDDIFKIKGEANSGILIRVIGGPDEDVIIDSSRVSGMARKTKVYDTQREENTLQLGKEAKDMTSTFYEVNEYDRLSFKYPMTLPLVLPSFNVDDGFLLGAGVTLTRHGFRKEPYKSNQSIFGYYAFATKALNIKYSGTFVEVLGRWDFALNAHYLSDSHVINYFGKGNTSEYLDIFQDDFDFNRMRYSQTRINPMFRRALNRNREQFFTAGLQYESTNPTRTEGRVSDPVYDEDSGLDDNDFVEKNYGSIKLAYEVEKKDHASKPTRGIVFKLNADWNANLDSINYIQGNNFLQLGGDLAFYYTLPKLRTTLGGRVGGATNIGKYEFFQAQFLGRRNNLRGYRGERFAGDAAMYFNSDVRIDVVRIKSSFIPMVIGVLGFYDIGRVWVEGENSSKWHPGYGGGVYIQPFDTIILNFSYALSPEAEFFEFALKFFF